MVFCITILSQIHNRFQSHGLFPTNFFSAKKTKQQKTRLHQNPYPEKNPNKNKSPRNHKKKSAPQEKIVNLTRNWQNLIRDPTFVNNPGLDLGVGPVWSKGGGHKWMDSLLQNGYISHLWKRKKSSPQKYLLRGYVRSLELTLRFTFHHHDGVTFSSSPLFVSWISHLQVRSRTSQMSENRWSCLREADSKGGQHLLFSWKERWRTKAWKKSVQRYI